MKLVGMLDSPFVRRVAISMRLLDIEFEHVSQSVVAGYDTFKSINPLAKAPTLVLDDGEMMIESTLIISHVEALAGRTLMPDATDDQRRALQVIGVALLGMDKVVAQIYETEMRPQEFQYEPWLQRVREQAAAGFDWLESVVASAGGGCWLCGDEMTQADITTAVAWRFLELRAPDQLHVEERPALAAFGARAEAIPEFMACPVE
jgi:glutathione S-transferase